MRKIVQVDTRENDAPDEPVLTVQALVVTHGPFKGRICENDDDAFVSKSELSGWETAWFEEAGVKWRQLEADEHDDDLDFNLKPDFYVGVDCEIVTFGFYLSCAGHYYIPRQFLRPATTRDLIQRHQEIGELVFKYAWLAKRKRARQVIVDLLKEQNYIVNELWAREKIAQDVKEPRDVFLCHSSADKPFVRQVWSDLATRDISLG